MRWKGGQKDKQEKNSGTGWKIEQPKNIARNRPKKEVDGGSGDEREKGAQRT